MKSITAGLVSVSFRNHTAEQILIAAKNAGLSQIEWGSDVHAPCDYYSRLEEIAVLQKKYGIFCCSYGTYFRLGKTDMTELESHIAAAKMLGTDVLRLWCGDRNSSSYSDEEKKALFSECKRAAEIAEKGGVTLCMECHNNTYTETLDGALELMSEVNSQSFGMYWQPNQFKDLETNLEYAKKISRFVKRIHVFNWQGDNKYPLSEAVDTWKKYICCFDKSVFPLLEFMPDGRIESLEKEASALYEILQ